MFHELEGKYRRGDFEAKVIFDCNMNTYKVSHVDFARLETSDDFDTAGRMMIEVGEILTKLRGE